MTAGERGPRAFEGPPPAGPLPGRLPPAEMYPAGPTGSPRVRVRWVRLASGDRVRVLEVGEGPAVVLLHGWGGSAFTFRHLLFPLADAGFRVVAPDLLGHGLSDKPDEGARYRLPGLADGVVEALDGLGVERFAVGGHSMGGGIALQLALAHPDRVSHLALLGAARVGTVRAIGLLRALALRAAVPVYPYLIRRVGIRLLLHQVYGRGATFTDRDVDEYWAPSQWPTYARAMWRIVREFDWGLVEPADVRGLRVPTLIMTAERDVIVSPREAEAYARAIPGARLVRVPGSGHLFPEAAWRETADALLALLRPGPLAPG